MKHHRSPYTAQKKHGEKHNTDKKSHADKSRHHSPVAHGKTLHEHRASSEHRRAAHAESDKMFSNGKWERELRKKMGEAAAREDLR